MDVFVIFSQLISVINKVKKSGIYSFFTFLPIDKPWIGLSNFKYFCPRLVD